MGGDGRLGAVSGASRAQVGSPGCQLECGRNFLGACDCIRHTCSFDHALATWRPKKRTRRDYKVFERDGWRCTAPGCSSYRNLHRHHIVFRSHQGSGSHSNLTTLCWWHHQRGVHGHILRCTGVAPDGLRFELGLRSDGPPLAVYRSGEVIVA